jgi:transposase
MANDTIILTRKVQIYVDCDEKEKRAEYFKKLFEWQDMVYRGSNMVLTHQYLQENIKDLIYLRDDVKVKLADNNKDPEGILNTSRMNTTYRVLSAYFKGKLPADIISNMNMTLIKNFNADRLAYWKGEKSLRNYKKDMPIPFSGVQIKFSNDEKGRDFKFSLFKIPFRTYLGKDRSDKRVLLQRALVGQIKICASSIKIVKGKIFLLIALELPKKQHDLKDHVIAEASLSVEHPITVNIDKDNFQIGNKEEFLYRRMAIQAARHRIQKASAFNKGGKGRTKKLKSLEHFSEKEKNYVDSRLHLYSRRLIDICVKSQAGTLLLVNQMNKEEAAKEDEFLLRNWSYYGLIEKIKYKASMAGINLIVE